PKWSPELALQYLACCTARQGFDEIERLWHLVGAYPCSRPVIQLRMCRLTAWPEHDDGLDFLTPLLRRHTYDRNFGNRRMPIQSVLDFRRINVFTTRYDHVFDAVNYMEVAVFIQIACVAGTQPSLFAQDLSGQVRRPPVSQHI